MQNKRIVSAFHYSLSANEFMERHLGEDPRGLAFRYAGKTDFPLAPVLDWMEALDRARDKAPGFYAARCFFTRRAFEQASSEATALYKAGRINGKTLLNLCGGIGVDDYAFSSRFETVLSLETNETVHEMAALNMKKLGVSNVERRMETAEHFVENNATSFDWVYADPDRRTEGKRLVSLRDCSPDVQALWPRLQEISTHQLLKLSPLYPLEQLPQEISGVECIEAVAVKDEVKEVLVYATSGYPGEIGRRAVVLRDGNVQHFEGTPLKGTCSETPSEGYFYEAHAALAKTDLGVSYAMEKGNRILVPNGLFQFSSQGHRDFMGRSFQILASGEYSKKSFGTWLKEKAISKAHFNARFFHSTPEELKAAHRIGDGGDDYFFFFTQTDKRTMFVHGQKPETE